MTLNKIDKKKKIIIIFAAISVITLLLYKHFSSKKELPYEWIGVEKKDIVQRILASGQVISPKKIVLQFEISGKIKEIRVEKGEEVKTNEILISLDTRELETQVWEAAAAWDVAKASLEKILAGATEEEIRIYETAVENAQISLENAQISLKNAEQNLTDVQSKAQADLRAAYEDAENTVNDSYLKIYNSFDTTRLIQLTYFWRSDQESLKVIESKNAIENSLNQVKIFLELIQIDFNYENIDLALSKTKNHLQAVSLALTTIRQMCESSLYRDQVSSSDRTSLDTQRTNINTAVTNITNGQQTISSAKVSNELNINTAKAGLDSAQSALKTAEGNLKSAQDKLTQIKAPPQEAEVSLARAKVEQAVAVLNRARQQLEKAKLSAPCEGTITDIKKKEGEQIQTTEAAAAIICKGNFQVEIDIPEADIGKVGLQNPVKIYLDAFPEETFSGKVIAIDPAETIIQGVVYYKVTISFEEFDSRIKPGMTADVDIITQEKEQVFAVPQRAVLEKNGKKYVRILVGKEIKEIEVTTGIRGSEGEIEIISGLKEGERVITFLK